MRSRAESAPSFLYVPELGEPGARLELTDSESHYLARVVRARPGDRATGTDGRGTVAALRVIAIGSRVQVEIEHAERHEPKRRAWVWSGAPEGSRADWLVEKLAELGVERWLPLQCERGSWSKGAARQERWDRLALAAMRQSRGSTLMTIEPPLPLTEAIVQAPAEAARWLASPKAPRRAPDGSPGLMIGAIGPAEGFTPSEGGALEAAGFQGISLAERRLRSETASLAWALWWANG
jgi:16S rRNA (uracil1498-N3)-methyltransferase